MRGLAVFDPRAVTSGQRPPLSVLVESVVADGKELVSDEDRRNARAFGDAAL